jgi:hypothetical protein
LADVEGAFHGKKFFGPPSLFDDKEKDSRGGILQTGRFMLPSSNEHDLDLIAKYV